MSACSYVCLSDFLWKFWRTQRRSYDFVFYLFILGWVRGTQVKHGRRSTALPQKVLLFGVQIIIWHLLEHLITTWEVRPFDSPTRLTLPVPSLVADMQLYKRLDPSVHWSVGASVGPSCLSWKHKKTFIYDTAVVIVWVRGRGGLGWA